MGINYDLHDLRALEELARQGSFNRAADALSITPSALSRRIAKLEAAIGGRLVERTTRSMVFTPLGDVLLKRVLPQLQSLDDGMREAACVARGLAGRVVVACTASVAHALFTRAVSVFHQQFPDVQVCLRDDAGSRVREMVLKREVEFGVTALWERHDELVTQCVANDAFMLVTPPGHPLAGRDSVRWDELADSRVLTFRSTSSTRQEIDPVLKKAGISLPWFNEVDHLSSMIGYLQHGESVAVLTGLLATQLKGVVAIPLTAPRIGRRIFLARHQDMALAPPAQCLWDILARIVKQANRRSATKGTALQ